jgi:hypothetical protein
MYGRASRARDTGRCRNELDMDVGHWAVGSTYRLERSYSPCLDTLVCLEEQLMPIPKPWKLTFPRLKCPHCKRIITVAFYGRYRLTYSKRLNARLVEEENAAPDTIEKTT